MLRRWFEAIRRDDDGQDLIEYTLLLAFLALASASIFLQVGNSGAGVWSGARTTIDGAATAGTGTASAAPPAATPPPPSGGGGHRDGDHDYRH